MQASNGYVLGVIGGSGLYALDGLKDVESLTVPTPFGDPSGEIVRGRLGNTTLLFLPRHGAGHRIPPTAINYRANICALKRMGATHLISVSAVGSMKENIKPGDVVLVDQFIDLTKHRTSTYFDDGIAVHVAFSDPVCRLMANAVAAAAESLHATVHRGGTYVCMEGPQFSTRAESHVYRSWGVSVIGMTSMPEAKLAREAELPFCTLALATDYDCWHESEEAVTVDAVLKILKQNVSLAKDIIASVAASLPDPTKSIAYEALKGSVISTRDSVSPRALSRLGWLLNPYLGSSDEQSQEEAND